MIGNTLEDEFIDNMVKHHNFSSEGAAVLFEHLKQLHKDLSNLSDKAVKSLENDKKGYYSKALNEFNYSEYDSVEQLLEDYELDANNVDDMGIGLEYLKDKTWLIEIPNTERLIIYNYRSFYNKHF